MQLQTRRQINPSSRPPAQAQDCSSGVRHRAGWRPQAFALAVGSLLAIGGPLAGAQTPARASARKLPEAAIAAPNSRQASPANQEAISKAVQRLGPSPGVPRVPNVVGLTWAEAESLLRGAGFEVKRILEDQPDPSVPYGHVRATVPAAGMLADAPVELRIPRVASRLGIGELSQGDLERRSGFDLDEGRYEEITHGADIVLRKHEAVRKTLDNGRVYYDGEGMYLEPSDGAVLARLDDVSAMQSQGLGSYDFYAKCEHALKSAPAPVVQITGSTVWHEATICVQTSTQTAVVQFLESDNPCCLADYKFHYAIFPPARLERPQRTGNVLQMRK